MDTQELINALEKEVNQFETPSKPVYAKQEITEEKLHTIKTAGIHSIYAAGDFVEILASFDQPFMLPTTVESLLSFFKKDKRPDKIQICFGENAKIVKRSENFYFSHGFTQSFLICSS